MLANNEHYVPLTLIQQILDAALAPEIQTLVLKLVTRTIGNTVTLTKQEFIDLVGVGNSWNTARTRLTPIRAVAHVNTNEHVYITWLDPDGKLYPPTFGSRVIFEGSSVIPERSSVISNYGKTEITGDLNLGGHTIYETTDLVVSKYKNLLAALGEFEGVKTPTQTNALLRDPEVGLWEAVAEEISRKVPFEVVVRHVFAWIHDFQDGKAKSVGALANRICQGWAATPLRMEDTQHPLYWRHVGNPYQLALLNEREVEGAPVMDSASSINAPMGERTVEVTLAIVEESAEELEQARVVVGEQAKMETANVVERQPGEGQPEEGQQQSWGIQLNPNQIWQLVLQQLKENVPSSTFNSWIKNTIALGMDKENFTIGVTSAFTQEWLQNRLRPMIKRTMAKILGQRIDIVFEVVQFGMEGT